MRIVSVGASRPEFYDRTPLNVGKTFSGVALAPHGSTQRWVYTVPANRKAFVGSAIAQVLRSAVATTGARFFAGVQVTPAIGSAGNPVTAAQYGNTVGTIQETAGGGGIAMLALDQITFNTLDGSTGGTVDYMGDLMALEFDA